MSVKLMGHVWELDLDHGPQKVLLALADHAEDDGTRCYPSVEYIAWKTNYSASQVRRIMKKLREERIIEPVAYAQGGRGESVHYHIHLERGSLKQPFIPKMDRQPAVIDTAPANKEVQETLANRPENPSIMLGFSEEVGPKTLAFEPKTLANRPENPSIAMTPEPYNHQEPSIIVRPKNSQSEETEPTPIVSKLNGVSDTPPPATRPSVQVAEVMEILTSLPGWDKYGRPVESVRTWLESKRIGMDYAVETATALKAKWGGKGWKFKDPWATFQTWVRRPPLGQDATGRPRTPATRPEIEMDPKKLADSWSAYT